MKIIFEEIGIQLFYTTLLILFILFLFGCSDDQQPQTLSPVGNWNLTATFGAGDCGLDTNELNFTVTKQVDKFIISNTDPNVTFNGTFICSESCQLSGTEIKNIPETDLVFAQQITTSINATMQPDKKVIGGGSITWIVFGVVDTTCKQNFDVVGNVK